MKFVVLAVALFALNAHAATEPAKAEMEKAYAKMMEAATPGPQHKMLAELAGEYTTATKAWMTAADKKAMESKGEASMKMILGGRWLSYDVKGAASEGMPAFEGHGMVGFDNVSKKYETSYIDSMSTGPMYATGTFDEKTKTLNDKGTYMCPMTGKERAYRSSWNIKDKNNVVFSLYGVSPFEPNGKEFKQMEITFKRK